ncbi:MAG: transglutaminase domain-containing protein [Oscillibacter sp.]|nr:transglutaminase domain-containing protein [Oscillibacter sp.]
MSRERMAEPALEDMAQLRRVNRVRRARRRRRVRGLLLAVLLMTALALYAGYRTTQWAAARSTPGQEKQSSQTQPLHTPASIPAEPAPAASGGDDDEGSFAKDQPFTDEEFEELTADVLDEIVWDGMTRLEQARAVFDYVHDHIIYTGHSDKSDWKTGAYTGLTTGKGDCFTYYAVSRALLTALGIDNLAVERVGGETRHFWNLVNCGDGWYHFDACPRSSKLPPFLSFMFTDRQAADFTAEAGRNYYDFDGSLLPERATETVTEN